MNTQGYPTGYYLPPVIQMIKKFAKLARIQFTTFHNETSQFFAKFRMLFQDVVIFLPVSNFFKISSKVHYLNRMSGMLLGFFTYTWQSRHKHLFYISAHDTYLGPVDTTTSTRSKIPKFIFIVFTL